MNKRGFTLIEIIAVIALLGIMVLAVFPMIGNSISNRKETQYNNIITTIKNAAKVYYSDNQDAQTVSIATLIDQDYISSGLTNPIDGTSINGCVLLTKDSDGYNVYSYYNSCDNIDEYTITNLLTNSSFTNSNVTGWSIYSSSVTNSVAGTISSSGLYIDDISNTLGYWNYHPIDFNSGHKYYFIMSSKLVSYTSGGLAMYVRDSGGAVSHSYNISQVNNFYTKGSIYFTAAVTDQQVQIGIGSTSVTTAYAKDISLIDLTATFGAGNEPTKEWCDNNIDYFDGSKTIYAESNGTNEYTITNLMTNGSFENGTSNWDFASSASVSTNKKKYGNYSARNLNGLQYSAVGKGWISSPDNLITVIPDHIYYVSNWIYLVAAGTGYCYSDTTLVYNSTSNWFASIGSSGGVYNTWKKLSNRLTIPIVTTPKMNISTAAYSQTDNIIDCYADGALLVDLTAAFGSGNEPTKEWCDSNLDYFEGSIVVRK